MRSSRIGLAMFVVLGACGGAVNVGGPQDDAGSGTTGSSSGAGNTGSSSGLASSSSSSGAGGGSNSNSSGGAGSSSGAPSGSSSSSTSSSSNGGGASSSGSGADAASADAAMCFLPEGCDGGIGFGPGPVVLCPSSYAAVPMNQQCAHDGQHCSYPEGQCYCAKTQPATATPLWQCFTPAAGCPQSPPGVGTSCSQASLVCDYGACTGGGAFVCASGSWRTQAVPCPA